MQDEELPPWARAEKDRELRSSEKQDLPFGVYLLTAAVVAIAAVSDLAPARTLHATAA